MAFAKGKPFQSGYDARRVVPTGSGGRPPGDVRLRMTEAAADVALPFLIEVIEDRRYRNADRLKAAEIIVRYGVGEKQEIEARSLRASVDLDAVRALLTQDPQLSNYLADNPDVASKLLPVDALPAARGTG